MKQLHITILFALLISMVGTKALAYSCKINDICYNLHYDNQTATVTYSGYPYNNDYTGHYGGSGLKGKNIQIPSTITYNNVEYTVTAIGDRAFYDCESAILIASITIPSTVTSIGDLAFYRCTNLTSLDIPNSVTSIGSDAFLYSGIYANSSDGVFYVDKWVCGHKGSQPLGNLVLNSGTRGISNNAFYACHDLTSIIIPNTVTSIGDKAFSYCSNLTSIKVESGNTKYDSRNDCNSIIEAASNTLIAGCQNTVIPNSVMSIRDNAFYGCSGLASITIPNSVTSIGESAFYGCSGLTSITIPNSVTSIGESAFYGCSSLTSITIPNSITNISDKAFYECSSLTKGIIPNSVTSIGNAAFYGCCLASIAIPNSVTSIGLSAFSECRNLTSVTIPNSVTSIRDQAFYNCTSLTSVTAEMETPVSITNYTFYNRTNATLYVPYGSKVAYEAADYWKEFKEIVEMPNDEPEQIEVTDISQMDNVIYIESLEGLIGTTIPLEVKIKNTETPVGCSFRLALPSGFNLACDDDGDVVYELSSRAKKMSFTNKDWGNGTYDFALTPTTASTTISGSEGTVITFQLTIPDDMPTGDYALTLTRNLIQHKVDGVTQDMALADIVSKITVDDYTMGDVNGDGNVTPSDAIMILYHYFEVEQSGFNIKAADINGDKTVTPADAIEALYLYFDSGSNNVRMSRNDEKEPQ